MRNKSSLNAYLVLISVVALQILLAQSPASLGVGIAFTGQSSGDATKPNIEVTLTNISKHSVEVLQPRSDGLLQNLQFMVLAEGEDTVFVDVHPACMPRKMWKKGRIIFM
ncbi:MAG: hypothetical protein JSU61_12615 [Fidelibacterota bacterium]|nr:MAG: hypothetical protein JSU61_12615 [Candidatus Neomarinimicrobiota bacterium]